MQHTDDRSLKELFGDLSSQRLEPVSQRDRAGAGRGVGKDQPGRRGGRVDRGRRDPRACGADRAAAGARDRADRAWPGAGVSSLIVGGAVAIIAFALIYKGINDLKGSNLAPRRTVESLRQDAHMVKEQAR